MSFRQSPNYVIPIERSDEGSPCQFMRSFTMFKMTILFQRRRLRVCRPQSPKLCHPNRASKHVIPQSPKICHPDRAQRRRISLPVHEISHYVRHDNADYSAKAHLRAIPQRPQHTQSSSVARVAYYDQSGPAYGFVIFRLRECFV